jgi:transcriptional regulator with XRE-family HTH domain
MTEMNDKKFKKLRGRITEIYSTQTAFAEATGRDRSAVNKALNGERKLDLTEVQEWARDLHISPEEIHLYFFEEEVVKTKPEPKTVYEVPAA